MSRFLVMAVGDGLYAVDAAWWRASLRTHAGVRGEVPLHGAAYPVVDVRAIFELPPIETGVDAVLLDTSEGRVALLVDAQVATVEVAEDRWQEMPWCYGGRERLWFSAVVALADGRPLVRLRPNGLLASFHALDTESAEGAWSW